METWTISELAAAATTALSGEPVQVNGRTRDMPNERLIRWYTTIGLVDPPLARRGRVALYGRRHLLQLVAVKRRQAAGRTIAQVQAELTGATDDRLESVAGLPAPPAGRPEDPATEARPDGGPSARRFWTPPTSPRDLAVVRAQETRTTARSRGERGGAPLVHGVRLAPGVTLLLDGGPLGPEDLAAIETAARPLLDALHDRGLPRPSVRTSGFVGPAGSSSPNPSDDPGGPGGPGDPAGSDEPSAQFPIGRST